ncbi:MAG: stage II sporulation protein M [Lactobacillus sp.]|nr:stage II sporulation protein M [Lactobacillus sp.]
MRSKLTELIKFQLVALGSIVFLIIGMYYLFFYNLDEPLISKAPILGIEYTINLFLHNMWVYLITIGLFFIAPLPILYNWGMLCFTIAYNISVFGIGQTLCLLWPHGLVEVPTILLYQYLALKMMLLLYRTHSFQAVVAFVRCNYRWYLLCGLLVLLGAILEGMVG